MPEVRVCIIGSLVSASCVHVMSTTATAMTGTTDFYMDRTAG